MNRQTIPPAALLHKTRSIIAQGTLRTSGTEAPPSPCISICRMDDSKQYCVGCLRTMDELRQWSRADAAGKRRIWQAVASRCDMVC